MLFEMLEETIDLSFTSWNSWIWVVLVVLLALIICFVFFFIQNQREAVYKTNRDDKANSVRVFVIDYPKQSVTYFNVITLRETRQMPLQDFYAQFAAEEQVGLIDWISHLLEPNSGVANYREIDVTVDKNKKRYFSMLQVNSINYALGKIHMESYLLKYMSTEKGDANLKIATNAEFNEYVRQNSKGRGISCCVSFKYKRAADSDKPIDPRIYDQLKDVVFQNCNGPKRYLLQISGNEFVLADMKAQGQPAGMFLVDGLLKAVKRYFAINSLTSQIEARVGIVEHTFFPDDGDKIVAEARKAAELAYETNSPYSWYQKGRRSNFAMTEASYRTEVERIINDRRLSFLFRPMFSVEKMEVIGYLSDTRPIDAYFPSIEELKNYAERADDSKNLFATIAKNVVPMYLSQRLSADDVLFYPIRIDEMGYVLETFASLGRFKNKSISFMIGEDDIRSHLSSMGIDKFSMAVGEIRSKGYQCSLLVNGSELTLPDTVYAQFDSYIVSFGFAGASTGIDTKIRAELHALVEKLIKFKRPIMASDIDGWSAIELLVRSGLNYISAEAFAPYEKMITPISQKSRKKLQDIRG
ncbi:MAG: hypothetical protein J6038_03615, partial [Bacilli bacterium]|nr:hypothetical protein [Bacilli bacterium]